MRPDRLRSQRNIDVSPIVLVPFPFRRRHLERSHFSGGARDLARGKDFEPVQSAAARQILRPKRAREGAAKNTGI